MTTLSLGRGSVFVIVLCLLIIMGFSFALGMVSAMTLKGHEAGGGEGGARVEEAAVACPPAAPAKTEAAREGEHETAESAGREGGEGAEGGERGEESVVDRAHAAARRTALDQVRMQADRPVNEFFEHIAETLNDWAREYLPIPKDARLNPMLFLNKEIDEAKEEQDKQLQDMISDTTGDKPPPQKARAGMSAEGSAGKTDAAKDGAKDAGKADAKAEAPKPPPPLPVAELPAPSIAGQALYTIELGRFRSAANAQLFAQDIKARGYDVQIAAEKDGFGQDWFFVRLGSYPDSMDAAEHLNEFQRREGINGVLTLMTTPIQAAAAAAPAAK